MTVMPSCSPPPGGMASAPPKSDFAAAVAGSVINNVLGVRRAFRFPDLFAEAFRHAGGHTCQQIIIEPGAGLQR